MNADLVREVFAYDPETGILRWRARPSESSGRVRIGEEAGSLGRDGYRRVQLLRRRYQAQRLAWLYYYGEWPQLELDHRDGDKANNRISNLREVSHSVNMQNLKSAQRHNASGLLGAHKDRSGFRALLRVNGQQMYFGTYATAVEAHAAYMEAKRIFHAEGMSDKATTSEAPQS